MTTSKVNWKANEPGEEVLKTHDFILRFTPRLEFDSVTLPFRGKPGYQLVYRPTGHVMAEGVDPVAAVGQTYREQRILDRVKANPALLEQDPAEQQMSAFLSDTEIGGAAN